MKNTMKASDFIRVNWDWKGTSTQSFEIDGKIIKTNAYGKDVYWNGNDIPEKYTRALGGINYKAKHGRWEELEECINAGYDEIRFVLSASSMIRGYCTLYVWASNSQKAKEARAKMRAEEKAKAQAEEAKSQQAHELAQKISQMDAGEVCEMVENALEEIKADEEKPSPEKFYKVTRYSKINGKYESMGIWQGDGMRNFKKGTGFLKDGFYEEDETWIYVASEEAQNEAQELTEAPAKEITPNEPEKATEGNSEAQEDADAQERENAFQRELEKIRKEKENQIPREMIEAYNRLGNCKNLHNTLSMYHQYKDIDGRFKDIKSTFSSYSYSLPRNNMLEIEGERFYIRKIRNEFWLYWEYRGDVERWLLHDFSKAYFDVKEV